MYNVLVILQVVWQF